MWGLVAGDMIGAPYEFDPVPPRPGFPLLTVDSYFTDDTVMAAATAEALLGMYAFDEAYRKWGREYPDKSYGNRFRNWLADDNGQPYNSMGNGAAMRVAPVGVWANDYNDVPFIAEESAACTHNHPEGIRSATAVASMVFRLLAGEPHNEAVKEIAAEFKYAFIPYEAMRGRSEYTELATPTVEQALSCFNEATDLESAIRAVCAINCDTDTVGAIVGAWAEAAWGVPEPILTDTIYLADRRVSGPIGTFHAMMLEKRGQMMLE